MTPIDRLNRFFDVWPRVRFFSQGRAFPAFRSCGITGFYAAMLVTFSVGLGSGRSLVMLALLSAVCGASFFLFALVRKWITGRENLVLLEHVWFALACSVGVLLLLHEPPLGYLDAVVSGLAFFLAAGRMGCFLVGCCHGIPASLGVRYGEAHARDGFTADWVDVRCFPVQLVEMAGLVLLGILCAVFALTAPAGTALALFLAGYAVMRFGLEGIRADLRPHLFGISQSRWMALIEFATGAVLLERGQFHVVALAVAVTPAVPWIAHRIWASAFGARARALRGDHLDALRVAATANSTEAPVVSTTWLGYRLGASHEGRVISLSASDASLDLPWLCRLAAAAFPELEVQSTWMAASGVLMFELPAERSPHRARPASDLGYRVWGACARNLQRAAEPTQEPTPSPSPTLAVAEVTPLRHEYFSSVAHR